MKSTQSFSWHFLISVFLLIGSVLAFGRTARAQQIAGCKDWGAISKWNVTITISGSGSSTDQFGNSYQTNENANIGGLVPFADQPGTLQCEGGTNLEYL